MASQFRVQQVGDQLAMGEQHDPANNGNTSGNVGHRRHVEESTIETSKSREEIIRQTPTFYALKLHSNQTLLVKYRGEGRPSHQEKGCWLSKPPPFLMPDCYSGRPAGRRDKQLKATNNNC